MRNTFPAAANEDYRNNIVRAHENGELLLPNGTAFSMNGRVTRTNNHVLVMGSTGSSKTRSAIMPNLTALYGSYVISDPKGTLYYLYKDYLKACGYKVRHYNFIHPEQSDGYNPFAYARTPDEIIKLAHYITYSGRTEHNNADPFWDKSSELLLCALIGYMEDSDYKMEERTFGELGRLITLIDTDEIEENGECALDIMMKGMNNRYKLFNNTDRDAWSYIQYRKFRSSPPKTFNCVKLTIHANIALLDTPALNGIYNKGTLRFEDIGTEKTAVFVTVSDTDRSKDLLANTFFTQAMNALCMFADDECGGRLPVPVRFLLDDFATNCRIEGFENMIANIRSRNISAMIILQSIAQLMAGYGENARTIIDNCDTIVYMGSSDIQTAEEIAKRANKPLSEILDMPLNTNWVFRRGSRPVFSRTVDIEEYRFPDRERSEELAAGE